MGPDDRAALAPLRADPARTVLLFDFDGTLSPIVERPEDAAAGAGVVEALEVLAARYRRVAAVSGRPVAFLAPRLPDGVDLVGLYGLEQRLDGVVRRHPDAMPWEVAVAAAAAEAAEAAAPGGPLDGLVVEAKGLSLTLHSRVRPELEEPALALADRLARRDGLEVRPAKRSVELHPPLAVDKGTVVEELAQGAGGVLYVGDDVGDLPAFEAVARLGSEGRLAVAAVVGGPELPDVLREVRGIHLASQADVLELLRALDPS